MDRMKIAAIFADQEQLGGKEITVCGWARTIRDMKTFGFIELNDGSCFRNLQVVMSADELRNYKEIASQNVGAALIVRGTVVLTPEAKQPLELKAAEIAVEGRSTPDYPLQKKRHSVEFLRTIQHLRPRTNLFSATFRVRSAAAYAVHEFFQSRGFVYVHTPIITGSDCEGAGEMFQVTTLDLNNVPKTPEGQVDYSQDFFGKKTSLTVSGQLNAENFAMAFGDVYTFGPTFRAENSNTQRHAAEFWMIEPEMAFCDLAGDMDVAEAMIKHIITRVLERCPDEINFFNSFVDKGLKARLEHVATSDFARVSYTEAVEILKKHNDKFEYRVDWGTDLQTEHERYLTEQIYQRPVFVTDYPKEIKAFYMRLNDDGRTVAAADCLVPGIGEIIGGSQREERLDMLEARIRELGMKPEDYWWYCDLRRYGSCRHAGFGLGFERMVMYLTGVSNIRDVELHPRTVGSAEFSLSYAAANMGKCIPLMDNGHYHPTEVVSDKIPALLAFFPEIALHITRPIRWDSDHVVLLDDETKEICKEIVRCGGLDGRVKIALDYFDASINRISAWTVGFRNVQKALLSALLTPDMTEMQNENRWTELMVRAEELKTMPFGDVWNEYCKKCGAPADGEWFETVEKYEKDVLSKRGN